MAADITVMRTLAETRLGEQFRNLGEGVAAREAAFADFAAKGLPHRRIEAWHYTDLRSLLREAFPPAVAPGDAALTRARAYLAGLPASDHRVVLIDGHFVAQLSALSGLGTVATVAPMLDGAGTAPAISAAVAAAEALGASESVLSLNTAFLQGGVAVTVREDASLGEPLEILSFASGETACATATRSRIDCGARGAITVVERHVNLGGADHQGNHALVFAVGDGAVVEHVCVVEGFPAGALHLGSVLARLGAVARFTSFTLAACLGIVRRQSFLEFAGEGSTARCNGVTLLEGRAHADTTLVVTHTAGFCESREYYKTILDDESTGVYQGKVVVAPGAQKTDGKMLSKAVFLADGASMYNKPELEIFADDVVCGHGATVGYLDDDQLFYLRARGIPLREAQSLLLNAFAADAIEDVESEILREQLIGTVEQWLARRHL